jgi:hypothetical protein
VDVIAGQSATPAPVVPTHLTPSPHLLRHATENAFLHHGFSSRATRAPAMHGWFHRNIVDTGRVSLFCFFVALLVGFAFIRFSVRMIRADVRWWPGNVTPGGIHIHHVVFGTVFMVLGGVVGIALPGDQQPWRAIAASLFGVGTALVLDEFALIVYLKDVYWAEEGRRSVDAVFVAIAVTGLLLLGANPFDVTVEGGSRGFRATVIVISLLLSGVLAAVTFLKGKFWVGVFSLFVPTIGWFGAIRLARPASPWARRRYKEGSKKARRAARRDERWHAPTHRLKVRLQELLAGRFDGPRPPR